MTGSRRFRLGAAMSILARRVLAAVVELSRPHAGEEIEVLRHRAAAVRALAPGLGEGAAVLAHLFEAEVVDVRPSRLDELYGPPVELLEVIGRVVEVLVPVEAEPAHVGLDRLDVLHALLGGVGVVETEVTAPAQTRRPGRS